MAGEGWRPDLYVLARVLERLWRVRRPHGKTDLQLATRLNYTVFRRYLDWMRDRGLVQLAPDAEGMEQVTLTERGLQVYGTLVKEIRDLVGE